MPTILDIKRKRGINIPFNYRLRDAASQPYDLTDCTFSASIKTQRGQLVAKLTVTSPEPLNGLLEISTGDTNNWPIGKHQWDIDIQFPDGDILSLPFDTIAIWEVTPDVTRSTD